MNENKSVRVGDPHVQISNLIESEKLINFVIEVAEKYNILTIEFLGDLFNNHAVKRIEVEDFWYRSFKKILSKNMKIRVITGNHDCCGNKENELKMNALNVFETLSSNLTVINKPTIINNIAYAPYTSNKDLFIKWSKELYDKGAQKTLIAHQTFTGSKYDNGFFADDGIDPELISQENIISAHIHKSQQIGKCFYVGSPKWDSVDEANQPKGIWIYNHNEDGSIISKEFISTENITIPIYKIVIREGEAEPNLNLNARNYLEFHGKTEWINLMKKKYKGKASIKGVPIDRRTKCINNNYSLKDYLTNQFVPVSGINKEQIMQYLGELNV